MHREGGKREEKFEGEVAVADSVQAIGRGAGKTQIARESIAVEWKGASGEGARAKRAIVGARGGRGQAFGVAMQRFAVRQEPMRQQNRLRVLHVRVAGHGNLQIALGLRSDGAFQGSERAAEVLRSFAHIHTKFGSDHFVAAAAGVQLRAQRAEFFDQRGFDEMMNIFGWRLVEPRSIGLGAPCDFAESSDDFLAFCFAENSGGDDGARPGAIEQQFLREHAAIKAPGALEFVKRCVGAAFEAAAPHLLFAGSSHQALAFCGTFFGSVSAGSCGTVMGSAKRLMKPSASFGL